MSNRVSLSDPGPERTKSADDSGPSLRDLVTPPNPFDRAASASTVAGVTSANDFAMNMFDTSPDAAAANRRERSGRYRGAIPQSFFGADPWMENPTGVAPNGRMAG